MPLINTLAENKKKNNVPTLIKEIFETFWEDDFIFDPIKSRSLSYRDFFSSVMRAKIKLEKYGLKTGDRVCLLMENSLDLVVLYFALLLSGLCAVPIDPRRGKEEIKTILSQAGSKIILSENKNFPSSKNVKELTDSFYNGPDSQISDLEMLNDIDADRIFLITFTSGSTGIPKGVKHSFGNLARSAIAFNEHFGFNKKNIFFHNLPMTYMAGILNLIFLPFLSGSKIVIGERFSIDNLYKFWDIPAKYSVNTFWFVPTMLALLLRLDRGTKASYFKGQKIIGCVGTAPLGLSIKKEFERRYDISLYESYGLSETLFVSTNYPKAAKNGTVGEILKGVDLKFGADGEISIKTPWNFYGYTGNIKSHNSKDYFPSGDLGILDKKHFLKITGRKKDIIIKGGINISPKAIQDIVDGFDCFREFVIIGIANEIMGEKIVCFFVPAKGFRESQAPKVNDSVIKKLGQSHRVDEFVKMEQLPKNINGKIDKLKIKAQYHDSKN